MELSPYVDALRADLDAAAAAGDDHTRETARVLSGALDAAVRLCLLDALSAMAAEVTAATDLAEVEVRMHGRDPEVVVRVPEAPTVEAPPTPPAGEDDDDRSTARVTLRLPEPLKVQAEARAAAEGLSVNAWLVRAVAGALRPSARDAVVGRAGRRLSGYARS
jgi:hypothetical protein